MKKPKIYHGLILVIFILLLPFLEWKVKEYKDLTVFIIDKSVSDKSYREHKGLVWILNHEKYINKEKNRDYDYTKDYYGFSPEKDSNETSLMPPSMENQNLIYIADTYGVDRDEKKKDRDFNILYGGIKKEEIEKIQRALRKGSTLIAEFNTFASPTKKEEREQISSLLGLRWSGWIGRYFEDLSKEIEVPVWAVENYEKKNKEKWKFKGRGFLFVNEKEEVVVLEEKDIKEQGVIFSFTKEGQDFLKLDYKVPYSYWFDIVVPNDGSSVLASYEINLENAGKDKLKEKDIPLYFPAVIKNNNPLYSSYYFAGDYANIKEVLSFYKYEGISEFNRIFGNREKTFYWKAYVPMMQKILEDIHRNKGKEKPKISLDIFKKNEISYHSKVGEEKFQIYKNGKWEEILIKGVNLGIAKPGHFPGETAIKKEEYKRWFSYIGKMNANAIRVYTLHPPEFYEALYEHNVSAKEPLYVFHGTWINEERLAHSEDAFLSENIQPFEKEIKDIVDVVHGKATVEKVPGHAGGVYETDISPYVLGWIVGIEWDPIMVQSTNNKNKGKKEFEGNYFYTKRASPFEIWLAERMEFIVDYEVRKYKWQRPVSFTNWVTTDLLNHPEEPSQKEDLVSVNPNKIRGKENLLGGSFASYHVYPYYPDFLNYADQYIKYIDFESEKNNYAGYLKDLHEAHNMPILIAEFGVPASRGLTHVNPYGMNQGFLSEKDQGKIDAKLFRTIVNEGLAGGLVFTWQDEWFKRTWNTMDYDNPNRRPFWSNAQVNEQQFGLMSFDPGKELKIFIDGKKEDWEKNKIKPLYEGQDKIKRFFVNHDERYLYLRIDYDKSKKWEKENTMIFIDSKPRQGNEKVSFFKDFKTHAKIDFVIKIGNDIKSEVLIDAYYDSFYYHYGSILNMIPKVSYENKKNTGIFHPISLALNKEMTLPNTNERIPFQSYETGVLRKGIGDPNHPQYDSLADFYIEKKENILEIRIPWMLLNFKDPSQKEIIGDFWKYGLNGSEFIKGIYIGALTYDKQNIIDVIPRDEKEMLLYTWENWDIPNYHERLKDSYYIMQSEFKKYK